MIKREDTDNHRPVLTACPAALRFPVSSPVGRGDFLFDQLPRKGTTSVNTRLFGEFIHVFRCFRRESEYWTPYALTVLADLLDVGAACLDKAAEVRWLGPALVCSCIGHPGCSPTTGYTSNTT